MTFGPKDHTILILYIKQVTEVIEVDYSSPREILDAITAVAVGAAFGVAVGAGSFAIVLTLLPNISTEWLISIASGMILAVLIYIRNNFGIGRPEENIDPRLPDSSTIRRANQAERLRRWNNGDVS